MKTPNKKLRFVFAKNINNTGTAGIVDIIDHEIIYYCSEEHAKIIVPALNEVKLNKKFYENTNPMPVNG